MKSMRTASPRTPERSIVPTGVLARVPSSIIDSGVVTTSAMTSRERVQATVRGEPVDRVPVMTWLNPHAGLRMMAEIQPASNRWAQRLGQWLWKNFKSEKALFSPDVRAFLPLLYSGYVNQGYALDCGSDLVSVGLGITKLGDKIWREEGRLRVRDAFGSIRGMGSIYLDVIQPAVASIQDLVDLELPDASSKKRYDQIRKYRAKHPDACLYGESFARILTAPPIPSEAGRPTPGVYTIYKAMPLSGVWILITRIT